MKRILTIFAFCFFMLAFGLIMRAAPPAVVYPKAVVQTGTSGAPIVFTTTGNIGGPDYTISGIAAGSGLS